jgi:hypothetical protein
MTKLQRTAPYSLFAEAAADLGMSNHELAYNIGYSSAPNYWKSRGRIPLVAARAIDDLRASKLKERTSSDSLLLIRVPPKHQNACTLFLDALNINHTKVV